MQRMSRAQRLLLIYILLELEKPRIVQRIVRHYRGGWPTVTSHEALTGVTANQHHTPPTNVTDLADEANYLLVDGSREMDAGSILKAHSIAKRAGATYVEIANAWIRSGAKYDQIVTTEDTVPLVSSNHGFGTSSALYLYFQLGQTAALPAASAGYRGQIRIFLGAAAPGNPDIAYACLKGAAFPPTYSWVVIATG